MKRGSMATEYMDSCTHQLQVSPSCLIRGGGEDGRLGKGWWGGWEVALRGGGEDGRLG